jgi:hypothetical protein
MKTLCFLTALKIFPGPHGSCELTETIEELKRILHLHLKTAGR